MKWNVTGWTCTWERFLCLVEKGNRTHCFPREEYSPCMPNRVVPPNWPDHAERVSLASSPTHQRGRRPARRPAPSPSPSPSMGMAAAIHLPLLYGTPSPRLDMQPCRRLLPLVGDATSPRLLPLDQGSGKGRGGSLSDPASPSARPLERRLLPRLSLVKQQQIAPSSRSSHPAATMAG